MPQPKLEIQTQIAQKPVLWAEVYALALRRVKTRRELRCWWARDARRGRVREWRALVWGGVISEVGWLSLWGAPPRRFYVVPRNLGVWAG
jgi:hypothetical protein